MGIFRTMAVSAGVVFVVAAVVALLGRERRGTAFGQAELHGGPGTLK